MRLHGQRWVYRIGNSVVCIDNGFSWVGWAQERMVVNDETVQSSDGWFRLRQDYFEPWIVPGGEGVLRVKLVAGMMRISCSADLDSQPLDPVEILEATWSGSKKAWPPADAWTPVTR